MLWLNKLKQDAKGIFKEHPASIVSVLIFAVCTAYLEDILGYGDKTAKREIFEFIQTLTIGVSLGFLLCESNYNYKKKIGKIQSLLEIKKSFVYIIVMVISFVFSIINGYKYAFADNKEYASGGELKLFYDMFYRFFWVYLAVCIISTCFFMYKRTGESFEKYSIKAFIGCVKAMVVYGVISIGATCILMVFDTLIMNFAYLMTVELLIAAIVGYPALLVGLSIVEEKTARFSQIMVGYVFTGILAIATVIVYVYIFKIIVTWTFPSNEAYTIMTALFAAGIVIWTMAQGCTEDRFLVALKRLPILYAPFIVVQIMCISMRIGQYGITAKRYLGIMFIVFEVCYLVYYFFRMRQSKGIGGFLFPFVLLLVVIYYLVPGVNVFATITTSQKKQVLSYIAEISSGNEASDDDLKNARSAYRQICNAGNVEGAAFIKSLKNNYPELNIEELLGNAAGADNNYDEISNEKYIYANNEVEELEISDFDHMCVINTYESEDDGNIDVTKYELSVGEDDNYHVVGTVNLSNLVKELENIYETGGSTSDFTSAISKTFYVSANGDVGSSFDDSTKGALYLESVSLEINEEGNVTYLSLNGYYLYKD